MTQTKAKRIGVMYNDLMSDLYLISRVVLQLQFTDLSLTASRWRGLWHPRGLHDRFGTCLCLCEGCRGTIDYVGTWSVTGTVQRDVTCTSLSAPDMISEGHLAG